MTLIEVRFLRKHSDLTGSNLYGPDKIPKMPTRRKELCVITAFPWESKL